MIDNINSKFNNKGVSPVIGVILMVAVTVALVALVTVIVFDIGSDVSETPSATTQISYSNGIAEATVIKNENVEEFIFTNSNTGEQTIIDSVGSTGEISVANGDNVQIIAVMDDGSEQVIKNEETRNMNIESDVFTGSSKTVDLNGNSRKPAVLVTSDSLPSSVDSADFRFSKDVGNTWVCPTDDSNEQEQPSTSDCNTDTVNNDKYNSDIDDANNPSIGTRFIVSETGDYTIQITFKDSSGNILNVDTVDITVTDP